MHRLQLAKTSRGGSANKYLRIKSYKERIFKGRIFQFHTTYTNIYIFLQQ